MNIKGWDIYFFKIFEKQLLNLKEEVSELKQKDPLSYKNNTKTKFLKRVYEAITTVPSLGPNHPAFFLGKTLGNKHKEWRRVKSPLPSRYRLFFRFSTKKSLINYAWLNDANTLRKEGSKTDVYAVFKQKLANNEVPSRLDELVSSSLTFEKFISISKSTIPKQL